VIRNYARNTTEALVTRAGVKAAFGYNPMSTTNWKGTRPSTRMGALAVLRAKLDQVRRKIEKGKKTKTGKEPVEFSAEEIVLRDLLTGKNRLRTPCTRSMISPPAPGDGRVRALTTVEHAMDVHEPEIFRELARRRISRLTAPPTASPTRSNSSTNPGERPPGRVRGHLTMTDHLVPGPAALPPDPVVHALRPSKQDAVELSAERGNLGLDKDLGTRKGSGRPSSADRDPSTTSYPRW
jgi:hypothetical protein